MRTPRLILFPVALILALGLPDVGLADAAGQAPKRPTTPAAPSTESPWLETQVRLDRAGFSPGEIDGVEGANTRRAIEAFARARSLGLTNVEAIQAALEQDAAAIWSTYLITEKDTAGPFLPSIPADLMEQASLPGLYYTSALEMIAERVHVSPDLLKRANPDRSFAIGEEIRVPNVLQSRTSADPPALKDPASSSGGTTRGASRDSSATPSVRLVVSRSGSGLTVLDAQDRVVFFAPVTSGSQHDPLPLGQWAVTAVVRNPTFNYNPVLFWDADPGHAKAKIPPGPNGPVGTVWIDISKPHYGIHGTSQPGKVGHVSSHGCVRLTNWDAETVASLVRKGTVVIFEP